VFFELALIKFTLRELDEGPQVRPFSIFPSDFVVRYLLEILRAHLELPTSYFRALRWRRLFLLDSIEGF
jgi:hypothetical protein